MAFLSGERITAARLNRLAPVTYEALASGSLTRTTTTYADVPDATVTFTTVAANAVIVVDAEFDCAVGTTSTTTDMNGRIMVDGVAGVRLSKHQMDTLDRDTDYMFEKFTLAAAGSHTVKLQGALSAAAGSGTFQVFTSIKVTVYEVA
jgi:hypothetical protein